LITKKGGDIGYLLPVFEGIGFAGMRSKKQKNNRGHGRDRNMARPALDEEFPIHTLSIV